ncbi:c-type cytochrome [Bradyrhizobium sp. USDA 4486]
MSDVDNIEQRQVPGSSRTYTQAQIDGLFEVADWFPDEHPIMPKVVAEGVRPRTFACARCHSPTGNGHPQSAGLSGLPFQYLQQQLLEFKSGRRAGHSLANVMKVIVDGMSDDDIKAASGYFASLKPRSVSRVVEVDTVPRSIIYGHALRVADPVGGTEAMGNRIISLPENEPLMHLRDSRATFIDYVPVGSIERGRVLATTGGGRTVPCASCHGPGLRGSGNVPGIAGRPLLYVFRQLNDMKTGARSGPAVAMMAPVVQRLATEDMIAVAAYLGTLSP